MPAGAPLTVLPSPLPSPLTTSLPLPLSQKSEAEAAKGKWLYSSPSSGYCSLCPGWYVINLCWQNRCFWRALAFSSHGCGGSLLMIQSLSHSHTKPKFNVIIPQHWKVWQCGTAGQLSATPAPKPALKPQPLRLPRHDINIPNPKSLRFLKG